MTCNTRGTVQELPSSEVFTALLTAAGLRGRSQPVFQINHCLVFEISVKVFCNPFLRYNKSTIMGSLLEMKMRRLENDTLIWSVMSASSSFQWLIESEMLRPQIKRHDCVILELLSCDFKQ